MVENPRFNDVPRALFLGLTLPSLSPYSPLKFCVDVFPVKSSDSFLYKPNPSSEIDSRKLYNCWKQKYFLTKYSANVRF